MMIFHPIVSEKFREAPSSLERRGLSPRLHPLPEGRLSLRISSPGIAPEPAVLFCPPAASLMHARATLSPDRVRTVSRRKYRYWESGSLLPVRRFPGGVF